MREIKFRAWDKEQKVMYEVKKVDFSEQKVFCKQYYLNDWKFSEIELMQYTGLKDKNNKEIFEGDIVQIWSEIIPLYWEYKLLVQYFEDSAKFSLGKLDAREIVKVIGNIYETPGLLDKD